jgi:hypothetical protein
MRLGVDTTSVESYSRTATRLTLDVVGRSPRVLKRHLEFDYDASGATTAVTAVFTVPGAAPDAPPFQLIRASFTADSVHLEVHRDTIVTRLAAAVPTGSVVVSNTNPWASYEIMTKRLASQKADSIHATLYYFGSPRLSWVSFRRLGRDSMVVQTENDLFHVRVDAKGMVQNVVPIAGTGKFSADRVPSLDLDAMAASFAARESQSGAMGAFSPRDSVHVAAGTATLSIDYGRPSKRGRVVFGGVVPWGQVWRTGANAATQFRTDKSLMFGNVEVPAGFYTLWTIPSPDGWKLVVNSETGQWGTAHKPEKDLYTIDMTRGAPPEPVERFTIGVDPGPQGGVIHLDWDTTRASVAFTVKP